MTLLWTKDNILPCNTQFSLFAFAAKLTVGLSFFFLCEKKRYSDFKIKGGEVGSSSVPQKPIKILKCKLLCEKRSSMCPIPLCYQIVAYHMLWELLGQYIHYLFKLSSPLCALLPIIFNPHFSSSF